MAGKNRIRARVDGNQGAASDGSLEKPGRSDLSAEELKEFRKLLMDKQRAILGDVHGMTVEARGASAREGEASAEPPVEPGAFPDDFNDRDLTMGLLENERLLLRDVNDALDRIERGTFGVCQATGRPIGKARLLARPWSKYCIEYARQVEKENRFAGGATHFPGASLGLERPAFRGGENEEVPEEALEASDMPSGLPSGGEGEEM
jgi:DnaK suppressor protein